MISSGICCILGLVTACLVTNKNVDSQTPDPGAQLSQMYNTQVSPVLTVSVLDMDVTTGRSTFLPLIGYPVNHDFNLQVGGTRSPVDYARRFQERFGDGSRTAGFRNATLRHSREAELQRGTNLSVREHSTHSSCVSFICIATGSSTTREPPDDTSEPWDAISKSGSAGEQSSVESRATLAPQQFYFHFSRFSKRRSSGNSHRPSE